jgi:hypothetical protein
MIALPSVTKRYPSKLVTGGCCRVTVTANTPPPLGGGVAVTERARVTSPSRKCMVLPNASRARGNAGTVGHDCHRGWSLVVVGAEGNPMFSVPTQSKGPSGGRTPGFGNWAGHVARRAIIGSRCPAERPRGPIPDIGTVVSAELGGNRPERIIAGNSVSMSEERLTVSSSTEARSVLEGSRRAFDISWVERGNAQGGGNHRHTRVAGHVGLQRDPQC